METKIKSLAFKQKETGTQDMTVIAKTSSKYGDIMVSVRLDFEDGHSSIATMTVTHDQVVIAANIPAKVVIAADVPVKDVGV